jgi:hypothetical protein
MRSTALAAVLCSLIGSTVQASPETERPVGLWIQPLSLMTFTPYAASQGDTFLTAPMGVHFPVSPSVDLALEATTIYVRQDCEADCLSRGLSLSVGAMLLSDPRGDGFFLQPKLTGAVVHDKRLAGFNVPFEEDSWSRTRGQLSLGLDVGYRKTFGHLFLSFVVGGSVGRGWNVSDQSVFFALLDWPQNRGSNKWVTDLNANLFRVGASF